MTEAPRATLAQSRDPLYLRGVALVLLAGGFLSIAGIIVRSVEAASEWQILFYRSLALAITLLVVIAWRSRGQVSRAFRTAGLPALAGGLCLSAGFTGYIFSLTHTTVANAMFLLSASPFLAAVLGWVVLGEGVRRATWAAMAVAILGVGVMVVEGFATGRLAGNVMALAAAVGFAGFTVALRRGRGADMLPAVCLAAVFAAAFSGAMAVAGPQGLAMSRLDLLLSVSLGVVQLGAGLTLYTAGSRHVPAAELALLSLTEVVLGPVWVWLGIGEVPSGLTLLGGGIVLAAIAGHALSGLRRPRPPLAAV
jgi:drug/metabolite transporter (DMT)-like permease